MSAGTIAILASAVAIANLILTLLLTRRVLVLQRQVNGMLNVDGDLPPAGTAVPELSVVAADGRPVTGADLRGGETMLAFLTATCDLCWEEMPHVREAASLTPTVAVVIGAPPDRARYVEALAPVARVVEQDDPSLAARFHVRGFPAFLVVSDGVIRQSTHEVAELRHRVPA